LRAQGIDRYVLFVASAHKPNAEGFLSLLGSRLGYLPLGTAIVIVGSLGHLLNLEITKRDPLWADYFGHRCFSWGQASDDTLASLIAGSAAIILPITLGEGTNLKTPEALLSGKPIIATSKAFRGFEGYANQTQVHIADAPVDFRDATSRVLSTPTPSGHSALGTETSAPVTPGITELLWSATQHTVTSWLVTILRAPERQQIVPNDN
jgi:glycosyltransferase involved in cell wall biosynthesis